MERRNEGDRTIVSGFTRRHKLNPDSKTPAFQDARHRSVLRRTSGVLGVILAGLLGGSGCATVNTFETAEVLKPGHTTLLVGVVLGGSPIDERNQEPRKGAIPFGEGLHLKARLGLLPHFEVAVQTNGGAFGYGAKTGISTGRFKVAAGFGRGMGGAEGNGLNGYVSQDIRTTFGGITVAFNNVYAGYRLTDYRWSKKVPDRNRETFNAVVPGVVIGMVGTHGQRANLVAEFNVTRFPERLRGSFGAGVRIQLGALWNR